MSGCSPSCGCTDTATAVPLARVNGVALHAASERLTEDELRQRACTELLRQAAQAAGLLDAVYSKRLPIPGMEPLAANGYGGVQFTSTSPYSPEGRPRRFMLRGTGF